MRYIFYADIYFVQNFMMKMAVLYLALYCNKLYEFTMKTKGIGKIGIVAGFGTMFEIIGLLTSGSYNIFIVCVLLFEVPLMVGFLLGKNERRLLRVTFFGYFFTILINGIIEALWNQFGERGSYIFYIIFSCGAVIVGVRIWKNYSRMQKGIFHVELSYQGKRIQTKGLYDSGNCLKDPFTGKGVHIIPRKAFDVQIQPVFIPYQALGNEQDLLEVYYIDELIIEGERGRITIQNCPVGVTKDNLFEGKNYEIILNEEVF